MYNRYIQEIKRYLMDYFEHILENDLCEVLYDSEIDPEFSAVTFVNHLICYIDLLKFYNEEIKFYDLKSFFEYCNYTDEEYKKFENLYSKEKEYYVGRIFENTGDGSMIDKK